MKIKNITKLGVVLIVLIQTVQLSIAQVDLNQTNQNHISEIIICDETYRMDDYQAYNDLNKTHKTTAIVDMMFILHHNNHCELQETSCQSKQAEGDTERHTTSSIRSKNVGIKLESTEHSKSFIT